MNRWIRCATAAALTSVLLAPLPASARQSLDGNVSGGDRRDRLSLVAVPASGPVRIDGVFDEPFWANAPEATGFVQSEPREGLPASERTVVRVAWDEDNLYIAAYLYDSEPDGIVVNDIRKDFGETAQDNFAVILDTFADRRNGYVFMTNPAGARNDQQSANEGREINTSWDAVWTVRARRTDDGWTAEMSIPFRALRFAEQGREGAAAVGDDGDRGGMTWGINFSRRIRRRNEVDYWAPVPRTYGLARLSLAGDLTGLPAAAGGRDLRIKPYIAGRTVRPTGGPDYTQPVLPGEARVLPRELGRVLRGRRRAQQPRLRFAHRRRGPAPVLQPAGRPDAVGPRDPDRRRRSADRPRRRSRDRRAHGADENRRRRAGNQLQRAATAP